MEVQIDKKSFECISRLEMTLEETWVGLGNQNVLKNAPQTVELEANGCTGKV